MTTLEYPSNDTLTIITRNIAVAQNADRTSFTYTEVIGPTPTAL